jgi:uncharacterized damage-inducible protein DinB
MNIDYVRTLYDYNYGLHRRVWDCIMHLSDEQFVQDIDYSIGSVRNHMVHVMGADERWIARIKGIPVPGFPNIDDYPTRDIAFAKWKESEADILNYVYSLTDDDLQRTIAYDMPHRGGMKRSAVWQILSQIVNHGTDHRAQVLSILHRMGAPTLEQDLILYLYSR